jgi:hypothetical protein
MRYDIQVNYKACYRKRITNMGNLENSFRMPYSSNSTRRRFLGAEVTEVISVCTEIQMCTCVNTKHCGYEKHVLNGKR